MNRGTTLIIRKSGHLGCSVTGAPVPVIPGDAGSGWQPLSQGAHTIPLSLGYIHAAWFPHSLYNIFCILAQKLQKSIIFPKKE